MEGQKTRISAQELEKAVMGMHNILGRSVAEMIIADLEEDGGISFSDKDRSYALDEIEHIIKRLFGDAAPLLMERLRKNTLSS